MMLETGHPQAEKWTSTKAYTLYKKLTLNELQTLMWNVNYKIWEGGREEKRDLGLFA